MGRRSGREDRSIYLQCREEAGMTRAQASEALEFISESRLEKIETGKTPAQPEDILAMARAYRRPDLCNQYCAHTCPIGVKTVPEVKPRGLSQIVLGMLANLNALEKEKERLIEITEDERISDDELSDFVRIQSELDRIALTVESLRLWVNQTIAQGGLDEEKLDHLREKG
ncbi:MAG: helix-turn-helix domain-containing protein [Lachnospiraceae bacterium]|nr:helix-turn-helix domain-containing protein [Lachnospiraceae bacterium]